jgi:hypothetical protein
LTSVSTQPQSWDKIHTKLHRSLKIGHERFLDTLRLVQNWADDQSVDPNTAFLDKAVVLVPPLEIGISREFFVLLIYVEPEVPNVLNITSVLPVKV